mgnify:CR=1 FL=1
MPEDARHACRQVNYRNLVLNQRVEIKRAFISHATQSWLTVLSLIIGAMPKSMPGFDLSSANDLTALVLIAKINERWQVKPTFWLPADGIKERSQSDHTQYDVSGETEIS